MTCKEFENFEAPLCGCVNSSMRYVNPLKISKFLVCGFGLCTVEDEEFDFFKTRLCMEV